MIQFILWIFITLCVTSSHVQSCRSCTDFFFVILPMKKKISQNNGLKTRNLKPTSTRPRRAKHSAFNNLNFEQAGAIFKAPSEWKTEMYLKIH